MILPARPNVAPCQRQEELPESLPRCTALTLIAHGTLLDHGNSARVAYAAFAYTSDLTAALVS
jgi:hypothetical protein